MNQVYAADAEGHFEPNGSARESLYLSPSVIATRWACSTDKVSRILEAYRGRPGFLDLGSPEDVRGRKRRYSIVRIHPDLLARIESDLVPVEVVSRPRGIKPAQ